jgi:hypothetical protein
MVDNEEKSERQERGRKCSENDEVIVKRPKRKKKGSK